MFVILKRENNKIYINLKINLKVIIKMKFLLVGFNFSNVKKFSTKLY
jgi:hypothetical protein